MTYHRQAMAIFDNVARNLIIVIFEDDSDSNEGKEVNEVLNNLWRDVVRINCYLKTLVMGNIHNQLQSFSLETRYIFENLLEMISDIFHFQAVNNLNKYNKF